MSKSGNTASARNTLARALEDGLEAVLGEDDDTWDVQPYGDDLESGDLPRNLAMISMVTVQPAAQRTGGKRRAHVMHVDAISHLIDPPEEAEDAVDSWLGAVLDALDEVGLRWDNAQRTNHEGRFPGYRITLTLEDRPDGN